MVKFHPIELADYLPLRKCCVRPKGFEPLTF